ncbi:MAG: Aromatic amino acid aminotransferase [Candidatus Gottesmanbacteria bacterium GW2011_GWB1_43_11]|uniref:Aminotransferase n=1 Tax=Candidatus Gottesmanbacteria bacterium GW2011_GWB1_43_11 TaxID=1618446 RepID=A0A0G1EXG6_9BACT|nr:MAG: Aromatic amino acid aminotransferase [Candidatus Gottesmanbacteria bacterium GW2011_GWA2_42_16]KKS55593.1 MAG: Aromatic amino acid aminotransferase [Candidatus Gottesmanbacteria bacterium GW2011_GWA1_42_26]KKS81559.1 MAG: Aromatic amino acid aminotransferase [Candidatus Gottesmanbacteria bacterium GW2011_GWC1_43_10]KKS87636.1 MAG: Aromatic amino acid aminotransferase [Candidatus Gottesmanbacteria bacterium GW2011_GWB1_43_11]OGG08835.1 MAG: hypothetical protein A2699_05940 [Candidatus Go
MTDYRFAKRVAAVPDAGIGTIMSYAAQFKDTISLGQGAPQFPTPQFVYDQLHQRSKVDPALGMYNSTNDKIQLGLKELLAKDIAKKYGFTPSIDELYLTLGGIGGLFATLMSILEKGDEVVFFDPSYPLHLSQVYLTQATPVFVPLKEDDNWAIDIERLQKSITKKTKAIILTNPNNPTGTILTKAQVQALAQIILEHKLFLVLDEAYEYLTYEQPLFSPLLIPELRERTILSKSFSKEYAMTGWRIGYVWAPSEIINKIHNVHLYFTINPATVSIVAATIVLSDPRGKKAMMQFVDQIRQSREVICQRIDGLKSLFTYTKPQGSFYLFPKILLPNSSGLDFAKRLVRETGVITVPGESMGPAGKGHLRLSFSAKPQLIDRAFDRIDVFVKKLRLV